LMIWAIYKYCQYFKLLKYCYQLQTIIYSSDAESEDKLQMKMSKDKDDP